jgi:hypothetical protein
VLTGAGIDLLPGESGAITPYTPPEALDGRPAGARGDIFAFGAILYELTTGHRAFEGEGAALAEAISSSEPPPVGNPALDRLLATCLAKNPAARWPRMQKLVMELKLLTVSARREETPIPVRRADAPVPAAVLAELRELEARLTDRFARGLEAAIERIAGVEQGLQTIRERLLEFEKNVAADNNQFEAAFTSHEAAIQSARTAIGQTDDLVERVVEALESLQAAILDQSEDRVAVPN